MKKLLIILCTLLLTANITVFAEDITLNLATGIDTPITADFVDYYALKQLGIHMTVTVGSSTTGVKMADSGERDGCIIQSSDIDNVYKNLIMVPQPLYTIGFSIYTKEGVDVPIQQWSDLSKYKVAYMQQKLYIENHLPSDCVSIIKKGSTEDVFQAVLDDKADVAVLSEYANQIYNVPKGIHKVTTIDPIQVYTYLNKKYAALVPKLNAVYTQMAQDGTIDKIMKWQLLGTESVKPLVVRISSYSTDLPRDVDLNKAIKNSVHRDKQVYYVNLNTQKLTPDFDNWQNISNVIRSDLLGQRPSAIVVSDNDALEFVKKYYFLLFQGVPVIFCSVDGYDDSLIYNFENYFTGVVEKPAVYETVDTMLKLFPTTKKIFIINDYSLSGKAWKKDIDSQIVPFSNKVKFEYCENIPLQDLASTIKKLPKGTLILCGSYFTDGANQYYLESESQKVFSQNSHVPIFGLMSTTFGYGQLGGKYTNGTTAGTVVAKMMQSVLDGKGVQDIPIDKNTEQQSNWRFDVQEMQKFDIAKSEVEKMVRIESNTFFNDDRSIFEEKPGLFIGFVGTLSIISFLLIVFGLFSFSINKKNKKLIEAQKILYTTEELLKKESAIKEIKEYMQTILKQAPIGYALISGDRIAESNIFMQNTLGIRENLPISNFPILSDLQKLGLKFCGQRKYTIVGGAEHRFLVNSTIVEYEKKDAFVLWCMDTEDNEQRNDLLESLQKELTMLIDTLPIPLSITDPISSEIRYYNDAFMQLFEFHSHSEGIGQNMNSFYPEPQLGSSDDNDALQNILPEMNDTAITDYVEWQYELPNGKMIDVHRASSKIFYNGQGCILNILEDVSAKKLQTKILLSLAEKEKEANQLKSKFLMNMSHEIRTPMNAIIGISQLKLLEGTANPSYQSFKKIHASALSLLTIINDILDFSKMEAGKLEVIEFNFSLTEVITETMNVALSEVGEKPVEIIATIHNNVPEMLFGDKPKCIQILQNILSNAAKYTQDGKISLAVFSKYIEKETLTICFEITDTGIGMTKVQQEKLFLPFEQFHNHTSNGSSGTGLGTTITNQLVKLLGGNVTVTSTLGVGTIFVIELPFKNTNDFVSPKENTIETINFTSPSEQNNNSFEQLSGYNILICEDNEVNQDILLSVLEVFGIYATAVANGQEALLIMQDKDFDLILMDFYMPVMDGCQTTIAIRESNNQIPIIAMTGSSADEDIERCFQAGMNCYLTKPIDIHKLYGELVRFLKKN